MGIGEFAALGCREQIIHIFSQAALAGFGRRRAARQGRFDVSHGNGVALSQQQHLAHYVFQLPHITRPVFCPQIIQCFAMNRGIFSPQLPGIFSQEESYQFRNVFFPFAQWWQRNHHHTEPVVQVLAELLGFDGLFQVTMGRRAALPKSRWRWFAIASRLRSIAPSIACAETDVARANDRSTMTRNFAASSSTPDFKRASCAPKRAS